MMIDMQSVGRRAVSLLEQAGHRRRQRIALCVYATATAIAFTTAFFVRFEFRWDPAYTGTYLLTLGLIVAIRCVTNLALRLTTSRWRFVGVQDVFRLGGATIIGSILFYLTVRLLQLDPPLPRSVIVIESLLSAILTATVWLAYRTAFEAFREGKVQNGGTGVSGGKVLIIGAGESGYMLAREMLRSMVGYRPVGFVDDDPYKWGTRIAGLEVLGSSDQLRAICAASEAQQLILAVPQASPAQLRELVAKCADAGLPYRVLPSIAEVLAGNIRLDQVREVQIEDLLGRNPIELDLKELAEDLRGGCALVTGAAGSIGSELSRQIARHRPDTLLLLDQSETELFYLDLELREQYPEVRVVAIVRDVVDRRSIDHIFRKHRPTHVYHAAAYKHVPMMEANVCEAIRNNLLGSFTIADAAGRHGTQKFVLISTDKAVRPQSVMGASKRLAEIVTMELQEKYPDTTFAAVRFGNVLGSNGSVIPVFKRLLAAGKPLTVTHPEVTRYFMTIPEAVQLVLQASLLEEIRGHVAMLEMGEPVKIVDLAENLLKLSGVHGSEHLIYTGLRPGEKLHEELIAPEEETVTTAIPKVHLIKHGPAAAASLLDQLDAWEDAVGDGRDEEVHALVDRFFPAWNGLRRNGHHAAALAAQPVFDGDEPSGVAVAHEGDFIDGVEVERYPAARAAGRNGR